VQRDIGGGEGRRTSSTGFRAMPSGQGPSRFRRPASKPPAPGSPGRSVPTNRFTPTRSAAWQVRGALASGGSAGLRHPSVLEHHDPSGERHRPRPGRA
jgi:hypothetical protein